MDTRTIQNQGSKPLAIFVRYWLPVFIWFSVVFTASADKQSYVHSSLIVEPLLRWLFPQMSVATVGEIHHLFRKLCHLCEYAVLGWLVWRAIRRPVANDLRSWKWSEAAMALAAVFLYACSDEFHQIFVPTRTPHFTDVLIDTFGGALGLALMYMRVKRARYRFG